MTNLEADYIQLAKKDDSLEIDCGNDYSIQANVVGLELEWEDIILAQTSDIRLDIKKLKTGSDDSIGNCSLIPIDNRSKSGHRAERYSKGIESSVWMGHRSYSGAGLLLQRQSCCIHLALIRYRYSRQ